LWIFGCPSCAAVTDVFGGTTKTTLPRTRETACAARTGVPMPVPAAGTPVPRKLERGQKAPGREAQFASGKTPELMFITWGTSLPGAFDN
jgi:hypothetical protein